jgi:hypothetical protein
LSVDGILGKALADIYATCCKNQYMLKNINGMLVLCFFLTGNIIVLAQTPAEEKAIAEVISLLFDGMTRSDTAMMRSAFAPGATMASVSRNKSDEVVLKREESIDGFLKAIARPHPEPYYEEIWNLKISIDGDFAQAWCDFAFYVNKKFSHCGVDAFHLYKTKQGWKIFHLADTRKTSGCDIPDEIQQRHK